MKCMYAQTRPRFILSSEGVLGGIEFEPMLTPREKSPLPKMSPEEDRTRDAVDSEPKHYQLSYSGPRPGFELQPSRTRSGCLSHRANEAVSSPIAGVEQSGIGIRCSQQNVYLHNMRQRKGGGGRGGGQGEGLTLPREVSGLPWLWDESPTNTCSQRATQCTLARAKKRSLGPAISRTG